MKRKFTAMVIAFAMMVTLTPAIPTYAATITAGTAGDHTTLAAALTAAQDGDTISLVSDINEQVAYDTTGKTITIDGGGAYKITCPDGADSAGLALSGSGIVILKDITLQGGADTNSPGSSYGLYVASGSVNVKSLGTVTAAGGAATSGASYGVYYNGTGTVNVAAASGGAARESLGVKNNNTGTVNVETATGGTATMHGSFGVYNFTTGTVNVGTATGGTAAGSSYGVYNWGAGKLNVGTATGGEAGSYSIGVGNGDGTVNVTTATGGMATANGSFGVDNGTGTVNVGTATGGTAASSESRGVNNYSTGTVNVGTATAGTAGSQSIGVKNQSTGTVNATTAAGVNTAIENLSGTVSTGGTYVAALTLNKGTGANCVLDSITIAASGNTAVGVLPQVTKNGAVGSWYTDLAKTTAAVSPVTGTNLYSTFYAETYTISTMANQTMSNLTSGYGAGTQETKTLTVTRTGTGALTSIATALSGANAANFTITQPLITALNSVTPNTTFTVKAKDGLPAGTYTATVTITATNMSAVSFTVTQVVNTASSGSGGGGGTPATSVINTDTGSVTGNQLKNAADAAKDGGTVTIKSGKTSEVTLPNSGLDSLSGKNNSLTVVTENGTLTFDSKAVGAIGTQAAATDIKVIVDDVVKTTLTEEQQTKVGDKTVYDLSVMSGGKLITSFNGGKVNVSIPYELKTGETAENLTVWYMADNGNLTEISCTYDAKNKAVTFVVDHFSKYIIGYDELADWVNPFTDVKSSAWYYDAVAFVNGNDLMKGQTDTAFGPQTSMTRGMFVTILGRMEGIDATVYASKNAFSDVKSNQYYAPYITWATDKGIVTGMGGDKFAPNAAVTREQMAVMMTNYIKFKGQGPAGAWAIQLTYSDLDKVSSWADEAVMFMTMKDLMNGMGNDAKGNPLFAPKSTSTRAQAAQVMMSLGELVE